MVGVIDVGGGLKSVYGAAVFDYCIEKGIDFDYCIGISAGSANIASFLAGQKGRNLKYYLYYSFRKEYMSVRNFLTKHSYIDLEYVYGTLSNSGGENPLDYVRISESKGEFIVVASNAITGEPKYFDKRDIHQDDYRVFMASSAIPVACRPYMIDGVPYYDGGITDPVPIQKAFADGCDKVVVILSRPKSFTRTEEKDRMPAKIISRKYPKAAQALLGRAKKYNDGIKLAKELEKEGKVLLLAPNDSCGVETLTKDREKLRKLYGKGLNDAKALDGFLR